MFYFSEKTEEDAKIFDPLFDPEEAFLNDILFSEA
jgi:hypothetical protein